MATGAARKHKRGPGLARSSECDMDGEDDAPGRAIHSRDPKVAAAVVGYDGVEGRSQADDCFAILMALLVAERLEGCEVDVEALLELVLGDDEARVVNGHGG